ncbi:MAG TPA: hypothetical protein VN796_11595 [Acidimicrobiales bacterium]|nr:hypothetical protein [Acidimicrobiales bacterium]
MRRPLAVVATALAIAVPTGVATLGLAGPAGAVGPVTCTKVSGNVNTAIVVSKCTPEPGKHAKFSIPASAINNSEATDVWTWKRQSGVDVAGSNSALAMEGRMACKRGSLEGVIALSIDANGDPTGTLSDATNGDSATVSLCVASNGTVKLYPRQSVDWA